MSPRKNTLSRSAATLISLFLASILLIIIVWWPLVIDYVSTYNTEIPFWRQVDWLLIGIFLFMSAMIMIKADLKLDLWIVVVGIFGGLAIESWGTQTLLWSYYTSERPPLWIIPAWPIASLAIDRIYRFLKKTTTNLSQRIIEFAYWIVFPTFLILMTIFVLPTSHQPMTWLAFSICLLLTISRNDHRRSLLLFLAGSGLGYFLERWGTTRECWTYYTHQTPPLFAVLAHGLAAVAFFRAMDFFLGLAYQLRDRLKWLSILPLPEVERPTAGPHHPPVG